MSRVHKRILSYGILACIVLFYFRYPMINHRIELARNSNLLGIVTSEQVEAIQSSVNLTYLIIVLAIGFIALLAMSLTMDSIEKERMVKDPAYTGNELKGKLAKLQKLFDDGILTEAEYEEKRKDVIQKLEL